MDQNLIYKIKKYMSRINMLESMINVQTGGTHFIIVYVHMKDIDHVFGILKKINNETTILPDDERGILDLSFMPDDYGDDLNLQPYKNFTSLKTIHDTSLIAAFAVPLYGKTDDIEFDTDAALTIEEEYLAEKIYFESNDSYRLDRITTGDFGLRNSAMYYLAICPKGSLPPAHEYYRWMKKKVLNWRTKSESEGKGDD